MDEISLHQILTVLLWFGVAGFIFFLALIAQFYERLSGQRTYYRWFAVPALAFAGATARFASLDRVTGDWAGDVLLFVTGISLAALCGYIYRLMTSGR